MRRWIFAGLGVVLVLGMCELALSLAARISPRVDYLLSPPWRRVAVEDPKLRVRGSPYAPGHDANGFRNPEVPESAEIVAIGDSMTYGYAAAAEDSWPRQLERLGGRSVYNMSFGGYCPWQYAILAEEGLGLEPEWVVVALFVGNEFSEAYRDVWIGGYAEERRSSDPRVAESIRRADAEETLAARAARLIGGGTADGSAAGEGGGGFRSWVSERSALYGLLRELRAAITGDRWENQRRDTFAAASRRPHRVVFDAEPRFRTVFLRPEALAMRVDPDDPRIREGMRIVREILLDTRREVEASGARLAVAVIPSKQMAYEGLIRESGVEMGESFWDLVEKERALALELEGFLEEKGFAWVDTRGSLAERFAMGVASYPEWDDEHPNAAGYEAISEAVWELIRRIEAPEKQGS